MKKIIFLLFIVLLGLPEIAAASFAPSIPTVCIYVSVYRLIYVLLVAAISLAFLVWLLKENLRVEKKKADYKRYREWLLKLPGFIVLLMLIGFFIFVQEANISMIFFWCFILALLLWVIALFVRFIYLAVKDQIVFKKLIIALISGFIVFAVWALFLSGSFFPNFIYDQLDSWCPPDYSDNPGWEEELNFGQEFTREYNPNCTKETKICPDGSAVSRVGPNCEFASCASFAQEAQNFTYRLENESIMLNEGWAETQIPNSTETEITHYFGNEVEGDFNADGYQDMAFLLTQETGGSGVFYYVTALIGGTKLENTNTIFIGDRIAPQSTQYGFGMIIVNLADRKPGEPFSTQPSVGVSKYFKIIDGQLKEVFPKISGSEARLIAEISCIKGGEALSDDGIYNESTKTWWFDANLNATREGCNPACVVNELTKTAEINWRCTGLIVPTE